MRIYYDTEFIEDGHTIGLISIGMVAEDGRELYLVAEEIAEAPLYDRIRNHSWLMDHVVPNLPLKHAHRSISTPDYPRTQGFFLLDYKDNRVVSRRFIRNAVRNFILDTPAPQLWAWYGAYDHVVLCQLFGAMADLPEGIPMWTNDLKQECVRLGDPVLPEQASGEHNALADARHLKVRAEYLANWTRRD